MLTCINRREKSPSTRWATGLESIVWNGFASTGWPSIAASEASERGAEVWEASEQPTSAAAHIARSTKRMRNPADSECHWWDEAQTFDARRDVLGGRFHVGQIVMPET